jgi:hypothetical protein
MVDLFQSLSLDKQNPQIIGSNGVKTICLNRIHSMIFLLALLLYVKASVFSQDIWKWIKYLHILMVRQHDLHNGHTLKPSGTDPTVTWFGLHFNGQHGLETQKWLWLFRWQNCFHAPDEYHTKIQRLHFDTDISGVRIGRWISMTRIFDVHHNFGWLPFK